MKEYDEKYVWELNSTVLSGRVHIHSQVPGVKSTGLYKSSSLRDIMGLRNKFIFTK